MHRWNGAASPSRGTPARRTRSTADRGRADRDQRVPHSEQAWGCTGLIRADPGRAALKDVILYYRDYAATGEVTLSGRSMKAMLSDDAAAGDFRGKALEEGKEDAWSGVNLMLDVNGNGKFDSRGESFDVRKPFNIAGTTYEIADMARDGSELQGREVHQNGGRGADAAGPRQLARRSCRSRPKQWTARPSSSRRTSRARS